MNIKNVLLLVATLLCPAVSSAVCPVEHSTVFYLNGIGVDRKDTGKSATRLNDVLIADSRVRSDCVVVKPNYNYSASETIPGGTALDLVEALIQKASETGRNVTAATRSLLRLDDAAWIDSVLQANAELANGTTFLIDGQITEHLATYQTEAQTSGTLILVGHSQGNYYANEEWRRLSAAAKQKVHLVAVATPATSQADGGPYVTLAQDNWAAGVFALFGAPRENVSNTEPCIGNFNDRWNCHGWKESYMNGTNSRELTKNDIIAKLPATPENPGFFGNTVSANYEWPNLGTILYPSGNAIAGTNIEFPSVAGTIRVDFTDAGFRITYTTGWTFNTTTTKTFDGFVISVSGTNPPITGVSLGSTNVAGYNSTQISFDGTHVFVNQLGFSSFPAGSFIEVHVHFGN